MADASKNKYFQKVSGSIGDQLTLTQRAEKTIMGAKRGASDVPPTESQQSIMKRFRRATAYAKAVMKDAVKKTLYTAAAKGTQTAYNMAMKDAFESPDVENLDASSYTGEIGSKLIVETLDVLPMTSVKVTIVKADGTLVETGNAVQDPFLKWDWVYTATALNDATAGSKVQVIAVDVPGNVTTKDFTL